MHFDSGGYSSWRHKMQRAAEANGYTYEDCDRKRRAGNMEAQVSGWGVSRKFTVKLYCKYQPLVVHC